MSDLKREEYASPAIWEELRGLLDIAKRAWALRTADDPDAGGKLDEALDFYDKVSWPNHLARVVKETPFPTVPAEPEQECCRELRRLRAASEFLREYSIRNSGRFHADSIDAMLQIAEERGWKEGT